MTDPNTCPDEIIEADTIEFEPNHCIKQNKSHILWGASMLFFMVFTACATVMLEKNSYHAFSSLFSHQKHEVVTTVPPQKLTNISFDERAISINGKRQLLIAGAIHYPRSSPGMWRHLIRSAKAAGLNTIDTYVFWDLHEQQEGVYDFTDLINFLKVVADEGLWVNLRIGPYVCAEWNFGGFPYWIHDVIGLTARTWNQPFMDKMEAFVRKTVNVIDSFLASKGGNIIMMQIENEYDNVIQSYGNDGLRYISWAADLANSLDTGVPWIMCLSEGIKTVITTCNGFYCDNWIGPHSELNKQPAMFTELWSGWFQHWGDPKPKRPAEDLAFSIARFMVKGGTYASYYMWHGGTNFGRAGGDYQTASYDYDAPINEYGFPSQPKYNHLMELHTVLKKYQDLLLYAQPTFINAGWGKEIHIFGNIDSGSKNLIVFSNYRDKNSGTFIFQDQIYIVPKWTVQFFTKDADHSGLNLLHSTSDTNVMKVLPRRDPKLTKLRYNLTHSTIKWLAETVGIWDVSKAKGFNSFQEQLHLTKDKTDYLWYSLSNVTLQINDLEPITLNLKSVTDVWYLWVDNVMMFPNAISIPTSLAFLPPSAIPSKSPHELHNITILSVVMGLPNYGAWYDSVKKGLFDSKVYLNGMDLSSNYWIHQSGIRGEVLQYFNPDNGQIWNIEDLPIYKPFVWYKIIMPKQDIVTVLSREGVLESGNSFISCALKMSRMGKGQLWINGHALGRYWDITPNSNCDPCDYSGGFNDHKCLHNCGEPTQSYYHVPYDWLIDSKNQEIEIIMFEEKGGNPKDIELVFLL